MPEGSTGRQPNVSRHLAFALLEETDPPDDAEAGGGRPRYYCITEEGRGALSVEGARLSGYVAAALAKNVT
jgi:hypothetical protein